MSIILGIESTAHTFGVGVVKNGKVLSNIRKNYVTEKGGIIPMDAAKHHQENKEVAYSEALSEAGIKEEDIGAIAFASGPGLAPCLIEGMKFAKGLCVKLKVPLVPVNHCIAHLEIGNLTGARDPVMLYVSGANTQIIAYASGKYRIFGETLDIGVGNFIDTIARSMGLGFPGGPKIEKLALRGKKFIELPYKVKGMDIALSGIQTKIRQLIGKIDSIESPQNTPDHPPQDVNNKKFKNDLIVNNVKSGKNIEKKYTLADIAYSMQETVFAMLVETAERALAHTGKKELLVGGGVACNLRLQEMCRIMCKERGAKLFAPDKSLLVDNAAMIGFLGEIMFKSGVKFSYKDLDKVDIHPRERTDDVEVSWRK